VRFSNVWLRHGRRQPWVLTDVSLTLDPGTVATVVGRNGAGKSTLLAAAAGLLRPARGSIHDRPRRVGLVPERFPTGQPFLVGDYLTAMGRVRGLTPGAARAAVDAWAQRLHLTSYLRTRLGEVSKGTAQKVGLAQALLVPPDLLVLDEPWEGLDDQTRGLVPAIVAEVVAGGGCVLVSDHLGEVDRLAGAHRWHVADSRIMVEPEVRTGRWLVEVALTDEDPGPAIAALRAAGHEIVGVRRA
jgi:ABC-2 type transport system ATP-binding protein